MGSNGFHGNGRLGYNWQSGSLVTGIEANLGYANSSKSISYIPGTFSAIDPQPGDSMSTKLGWDGSIRGRLGGLLTPELLVYGTGGVAFQAATVSASCSGVTSHWCTFSHNESVSKTLTGWTLGAGAEAMLTAHWVARVEYSHADFGKFSNSFLLGPAGFAGIDQINGSSKITTDNVSLGLSYKF